MRKLLGRDSMGSASSRDMLLDRGEDTPSAPLPRRRLLASGLAAAGAAVVTGCAGPDRAATPAARPAARKGRVRQSIVAWCFRKHWSLDEMCREAVRLGCGSVELVPPEEWPTLKTHGLTCAIAPSHGFQKGFNNPDHQNECLDILRRRIEACAAFGCPSVITFTGYRGAIPDDAGLANCVAAFKTIMPLAEEKRVNVCLEMLNSRVTETMKGHPGYQGDHTDYCLEIVRRVGSPRMKLLFDIYHVQIMDGDLISRIRQNIALIGHVHTAGNPGRGELDDRQEINYPPVIRALMDAGYAGWLGQEFIPTRDPREGLEQAVTLCDV